MSSSAHESQERATNFESLEEQQRVAMSEATEPSRVTMRVSAQRQTRRETDPVRSTGM